MIIPIATPTTVIIDIYKKQQKQLEHNHNKSAELKVDFSKPLNFLI